MTAKPKVWRLDSGPQTLVLALTSGGLPEIVYWGGTLAVHETLETIPELAQQARTGGMLDETPPVSICPTSADLFPGQPGLIARSEDGAYLDPMFAQPVLQERPNGLTFSATDTALGLTYRAYFDATPETGVISLSAEIEAQSPLMIDWLTAPVLPGPQLCDEMIDVSGRWCGEFQLQRIKWTAGAHLRDNRTGRTGHEHFPGLVLPDRGASNTQGEARALHYGWSGGHRMIAEELPDGRRQIQFGHAGGSDKRAGTLFKTAPLYITCSNTGLNGCAVAFQRHLRDRIIPWPKTKHPRPVHYNCWEAVYFDHDFNTLKDIATRAADLGAERFVLDDGWFGRRDDDTTSLGDWHVHPVKYPQGLGPLIAHVRSLGMRFGLWFEPEMVNPDSDLYRNHSDWVLGHAKQTLGRNQLVLDMARPEVRDALFAQISAILSQYEIDYIKWDHNRVLPGPDTEQTHGTYELLDRISAAFPDLEIESCASGGGRIDFGILSRTQRVWLSDSNDAGERLRMQHDAALFLPASVTGSHVGPRHCHTSGRAYDIRFRAWVAAQRHMGFEMDPRELTDDEARILREVTRWWKSNRDWRMHADILRLESADAAMMAEMQLSLDKTRFVIFAAQSATSAQIAPRPLRLTGLENEAQYSIELINKADASHLSLGDVALKSKLITASGAYLMQQGIMLPWQFPETIWVLEGHRK